MGHGMERTDNAVYRQRAWHNLGMVIPEGFSPLEGIRLAQADFYVDQWELVARRGIEEIPVTSHVANIRQDTQEVLQVVSKSYEVVQNEQLAQFCEDLAKQGGEKIVAESVGTLKGGRVIYILMRADDFDIGHSQDVTYNYLLASNSHDLSMQVRITPTNVRVVCKNTVSMVVPWGMDQGITGDSAICMRHSTNIHERLEEARQALKAYDAAKKKFKEEATALTRVDVTQDRIRQFFLENYTRDFGEVPMSAAEAEEKGQIRKYNRAHSALNSFSERFDDESRHFGANMWTVFNSYSGLIQHDAKARGKDDQDRIEKRLNQNLFGLNQKRTRLAFEEALSYAV